MTVGDQASRVRNAARDMANAFLAYERAQERLFEAIRDQAPVVHALIAEGCNSPERRRAMNTILLRLDEATRQEELATAKEAER